MRRLIASIATLLLMVAGASAAFAGGSDSPTPYTVDRHGVTLPEGDTFPAGGHVNIRWTNPDGKKGIHFDPNNGHPGGAWIGKGFIPWSAFGVPKKACITWVQVHGYNQHFGEGGQEPVCLGKKPKPDDTDTKKVTLCHATSSESNPYVRITVSVNAFLNAGHIDHEGDIWPEFTYTKHGKKVTVPAQGDVTLLPDCVVPAPEPDPSPSPDPSPDPEPSPDPSPDPTPTPSPEPDPSPTPEPTPTPDETPEPEVYKEQYEYMNCDGLFRGVRLWQVIEGEEPVLLETLEDKVRDLTEDEAIELGCIELPPPPTDPEPEPKEELAETGPGDAQVAIGAALLLLIAGGWILGMRKLALRGRV